MSSWRRWPAALICVRLLLLLSDRYSQPFFTARDIFMLRSRFIMLVVSVCLLGFAVSACKDDSVKDPQAAVTRELTGQAAPDFTAMNMAGEQIQLSQLRGQVVVLNFWASWCPPCREEMPSMERLYQAFRDKGMVLLAVNVEENGRDAVKEFISKRNYSFPLLLDEDAAIQNSYGVFRFPETFIIDQNGTVVEKIIGGRDWMHESLYKKIDFLING